MLRSAGVSLTAAALAGFSTSAAAQAASGWPQPRFDGANSCYNPSAVAPRGEPDIETVVSSSEELELSFVIFDGSIFTLRGDQTTVAYDVEDGTERWSWYYNDLPGASGTPIGVIGEIVFVASAGGDLLWAVDSTSGEPQWSLPISDPQLTRASNGGLYFAVAQNVRSVDPTGQRRWDQLLEGNAFINDDSDGGGPDRPDLEVEVYGIGASSNRIYITTSAGLAALNASDGSISWTKESSVLDDAPAINSSRVYARTETVVAMNAADGTTIWEANGLPARTTTPLAVAPETVYVGAGEESLGNTFFALNAETGDIEWEAELGSPATASASPAATRPAVISDTVYVTSVDDTVHAFDADSGESLWRESFDVSIGPVVPANDSLYVTTAENELLSFLEPDEPDEPDDEPNDDEETGDGSDTSGDTASADETESTDDESDGSGPGFGFPAALGALGGAGYLLRRRSGDDQ